MILTIMIPTLPERAIKFGKLRAHLEAQTMPGVEIIDDPAPRHNEKGGKTIGDKRRDMLLRAQGEYVVGIDDDDWVPDDYIPTIMAALEGKPDCVGFLFDCRLKGVRKTAAVSNRFDQWESNKYGFDYVRTPHHLVPIKREHALAAGFETGIHGEDADFSKRLKQKNLIKEELFIQREMYVYHKS